MHNVQVPFRTRNTLIALALTLSPGVARADEPGIFGRIFRGGNNSAAAKPNPPSSNVSGLTYGRPPASSTTPGSKFDSPPATNPAFGADSEPITTGLPEVTADQANLPKLTPKSRVNRPITNAEPILTRFALGRSNDGSQFAMFMEIFADGTVLDSEGVHHVRQADLQPVLEAIQSSDFSRIRGHSGAPPTDFIDNVQIIVFDRRLGRLTAHPFSYSGNPQGTDNAIRHLHMALEGLQLKLSRQNTAPIANAIPGGPAPAPALLNPAAQPALPLIPPTLNATESPTTSLPPQPASNTGMTNSRSLPSPTLPNPSAGSAATATKPAADPFSRRASVR